ncbi:Uncharacterised protein [Budvicia aquatica]|uniref:Uncharacterized protein n=1 Tax=Budvicia aquatica TaxID=82979 RepID=A0A484ZW00_9GAMM|nr:Uncharacterised protein [Budvicia aquatica]
MRVTGLDIMVSAVTLRVTLGHVLLTLDEVLR